MHCLVDAVDQVDVRLHHPTAGERLQQGPHGELLGPVAAPDQHHRCDAGIVFLPGAGGTVQEVFQDACENYYADESSVAPMVLVGAEYWTRTLPAWPLLRALARGRTMEPHVHLVDSVEEAAAVVGADGGQPASRPGTERPVTSR